MTKKIDQILANQAAHAVRSEMGMAVAKENGNYQLAAFNCEQAFESRLMQGLITWRSGDNPTQYFEQAISRFAQDWQTLQEIDSKSPKLSDARYEQVYFVAYLVDQPLPFSAQSNAAEAMQCDRRLDAALGQWLFDGWDASLWNSGMEELKRKGSPLAVETYSFYRQVMETTMQDLPELEATADQLFRRRKKDGFFSGGVRTSGGGPDNDVTVDYRFAALAKRVGYAGNSIHAWRW
ncbi:hypothetical protein NG895_15255 [Aeoliella sp. ICT_H6.2]|uniref:Uncharacterized protein n=1 Tax=Aeoliella straminimaris TaxID=2954799 RepID=A0A9X2JI42_9BACT|nr:hypothetical protein [Aeoliella straminimaris]MCO6045268.1 hypothetical protein [Aeoliella straminimaris]